MATSETSTKKVVARLKREGWIGRHGGSHDLYKHPARPGVRIAVPSARSRASSTRYGHNTLSPGVARSIAKAAGWIE